MKSGAAASGAPSADNPTLYKAVEQKDTNAPPPAASAATGSTTGTKASADSETKQSDAAPDAAAVLSASNYFVQVAAVSKQDDAQALVDALKKKQYTAFATNSSPTDKLYHVQVGPFGDVKDAEATKAKLVGDGYNPILKK
jgi:cell division septation protein DedD